MLKRSLTLMQKRHELYKAKLFFYLFLASLTMFFGAAMVSYAVIRTQAFQPIKQDYMGLNLPAAFWLSTVILILVSVFLQRSVWLVRRERPGAMHRWLVYGFLGAVVFMVLQYFGMERLVEVHMSQFDGSAKAYGICFTLALLHALHVFGGIFFLAYVIWQSGRSRYDHEHHFAVEHCASYWHFLDVVWVIMLATFVVTG